jgi:hypothetical protein
MKDKLKLEIEKGVDEKNSKIGVSVNIDIANGEGSNSSGSVLLITKCSSYKILQEEVSRIKEELDTLLAKCSSYKILQEEVSRIKEELDTLLDRSKGLFEGEAEEEGMDVNEDMSAKEIWDILSMIKDPEILLVKFNSLSHQRRLEVADYVFDNCAIFSGVASVFLTRYNSEEGILE